MRAAALDTYYQLAKTLEARQSVGYSVFSNERTGLVLEPLRWVLAALDNDRPYEWLAFEQVPAVLPVWERNGRGVPAGGLHRRVRQALRRTVRRAADP